MARSRLIPALALSVLMTASGSPAAAGFSVCNKTDHAMTVAIGFAEKGEWRSQGWWRVEPKACAPILRGTLKARYYYLRAVHLGVEGAWDGDRSFCVKANNFTIRGRSRCNERGFGTAAFFEIDTERKSSWVQNLSD